MAIDGLAELIPLLESGDSADSNYTAISAAFAKMFDRPDAVEVSEANRVIAQSILARRQAFKVEIFVPKMVQMLKIAHLKDTREVFQCFQMLLDEKNEVLQLFLYQIIFLSLKMLSDRSQRSSAHTRDIVIKFLKKCRERSALDHYLDSNDSNARKADPE